MKVKELIAELSKIDPNLEVIMQKDSEGNGYGPLSGADSNCIYDGEDVWNTDWTADEADMDEKDWELFKKENERCCVLYPSY